MTVKKEIKFTGEQNDKQCRYISHDKVMIRNFMEEPEYADFLMSEVLSDGDAGEISLVQGWYDEARMRVMGAVAQA